jgi:hypothetical protein
MSQHSEDRLSAPMEPRMSTARILPFERPQSDLQKAVQLRAQESMALSRERQKQKGPVWRSMIALSLALVPVLVMLVGLDGFLRVFHHINEVYAKMPGPVHASAPAPVQSSPGVVMLSPMETLHEPDPVRASPPPAKHR